MSRAGLFVRVFATDYYFVSPPLDPVTQASYPTQCSSAGEGITLYLLTTVLLAADWNSVISQTIRYKLSLGLKGIILGPKRDTRVTLGLAKCTCTRRSIPAATTEEKHCAALMYGPSPAVELAHDMLYSSKNRVLSCAG